MKTRNPLNRAERSPGAWQERSGQSGRAGGSRVHSRVKGRGPGRRFSPCPSPRAAEATSRCPSLPPPFLSLKISGKNILGRGAERKSLSQAGALGPPGSPGGRAGAPRGGALTRGTCSAREPARGPREPGQVRASWRDFSREINKLRPTGGGDGLQFIFSLRSLPGHPQRRMSSNLNER